MGRGMERPAHRGANTPDGQRHGDVNRILVRDSNGIDQPEVKDIDRDFRIIDRAAGFDHAVIKRVVGR